MRKRMEALACALTLIISWGVYFCSAESGFLSLDCGGTQNRTDPKTGITWTPDDNYIHGGYRIAHNDPNLEFYQENFRVFPKPLIKSCYNLPFTPDIPFLLRLYFVGVSYSNEIPEFSYSIETKDMLNLRPPTAQTETPQVSKKILVSAGQTLYICLIRNVEDVDPFISSIEVRPLRQGMYAQVTPGLMLHFLARKSLGASDQPVIRYPQDQFDRTWDPLEVEVAQIISSLQPISINNTQDLPPPLVMQTAVSSENVPIDFQNAMPKENNLLLLYFAEIENISGSRIFSILINNEIALPNLNLVRNDSAIEVQFLTDIPIFLFTLVKASNSTMGLLLNAFELYRTVSSSSLTSSGDALASVKNLFNLRTTWISDPCFAHPWEGIECIYISAEVRVSEMNLSNRNLTGSIPSSLGSMTALIKITCDQIDEQ